MSSVKKNKEEKNYEVTPEGSLGILALGYKGIKKWKEVRDAASEKIKNNNSTSGSDN